MAAPSSPTRDGVASISCESGRGAPGAAAVRTVNQRQTIQALLDGQAADIGTVGACAAACRGRRRRRSDTGDRAGQIWHKRRHERLQHVLWIGSRKRQRRDRALPLARRVPVELRPTRGRRRSARRLPRAAAGGLPRPARILPSHSSTPCAVSCGSTRRIHIAEGWAVVRQRAVPARVLDSPRYELPLSARQDPGEVTPATRLSWERGWWPDGGRRTVVGSLGAGTLPVAPSNSSRDGARGDRMPHAHDVNCGASRPCRAGPLDRFSGGINVSDACPRSPAGLRMRIMFANELCPVASRGDSGHLSLSPCSACRARA